jgi:uncharacterized protein DUF5615
LPERSRQLRIPSNRPMGNSRFLCDENVPRALTLALQSEAATSDVLQVGDHGAPPAGMQDSELLLEAESLGRVLVSSDRRTMPVHLTAHFLAGHHTAGVILLRNGFSVARYVQEIVREAKNLGSQGWADRTIYLP